jgi:hypothetical protein
MYGTAIATVDRGNGGARGSNVNSSARFSRRKAAPASDEFERTFAGTVGMRNTFRSWKQDHEDAQEEKQWEDDKQRRARQSRQQQQQQQEDRFATAASIEQPYSSFALPTASLASMLAASNARQHGAARNVAPAALAAYPQPDTAQPRASGVHAEPLSAISASVAAEARQWSDALWLAPAGSGTALAGLRVARWVTERLRMRSLHAALLSMLLAMLFVTLAGINMRAIMSSVVRGGFRWNPFVW